ncbi:MAG: hypothetical protein WCV73_01260 [Patescibacteria group bacterium]|jgi:hypothetical protein
MKEIIVLTQEPDIAEEQFCYLGEVSSYGEDRALDSTDILLADQRAKKQAMEFLELEVLKAGGTHVYIAKENHHGTVAPIVTLEGKMYKVNT